MFDSAKVSSTESDPAPAKQVATPVAPHGQYRLHADTDAAEHPGRPRRSRQHTSGKRSVAAREPAVGAPVDLWDSGWPNGRFFWTVVPVAFESADADADGARSGHSARRRLLQDRQHHGLRRRPAHPDRHDSTQEPSSSPRWTPR